MRLPELRRLFRLDPTRRSIERDVDDEIHFHLQMRIEDLMRQGQSPEAARDAAAREYGDLARARDELTSIDRRHARRGAWREWAASLGQDVRFGLRGLRSRPGFAITVLLTLTLGIGANAAIFSVVSAVLLRPLPYAKPDRLVHLWEVFQSKVDSRSEASYPDYLDWRARNRVFSDMAGYQGSGFLLGAESPVTVTGGKVTSNFFDVLGVHAIVGRTFGPGDDAVGAPRLAVISYGLWERQYGRDPRVVGRAVTIDGGPATIVGVLPADFQFTRIGNAELWATIDRGQDMRERRGAHWLNVVARLKPGVTLGAAKENMSGIMKDLAREYPPTNAGRDGKVVPLRDELVGSIRPLLFVLYGAVAVVLLVACANVANLLLMRAADRQREIAVRVALGAGQGRLVRQLLTESLMLAVVGGAMGLGLAQIGVRALIGAIPPQARATAPGLATAGVNMQVVMYGALVSLGAGILFGLVPALRAVRPAIHNVLKSGSRGSTGGSLRDWLVVAEVSLTIVLMSGAALFGRSLMKLLSVNLGFQSSHIVTAGVLLPAGTYGDGARSIAFFDRLASDMRGQPGVESVGLVSKLPLDFGNSTGFQIVGRPPAEAGKDPSASYRDVTPGYFETMRIPLLSGRLTTAGDAGPRPSVMVVNRAFVRAYFDGGDVSGQAIAAGRDTVRIVGVVGDVPIGKIEDTIPPTIYIPLAQDPETFMRIAIRSARPDGEVVAELRSVVSHIDAGAALVQPSSMDDLVTGSPSVFLRRFPLLLVGAFAATALALAIIGVYGVVSYSVAQRSREMGIRMALGAQPRNLVGLVVRQGGVIAAGGIVIGVSAALMLSKLVSGMLYGVASSDPLTYVAVSGLLAAVAMASTIGPARRATRVDPAAVLRAD